MRIGQTRVTNSQAVTHESWLVRCSPRPPQFSRAVSNLQNKIFIVQIILKLLFLFKILGKWGHIKIVYMSFRWLNESLTRQF